MVGASGGIDMKDMSSPKLGMSNGSLGSELAVFTCEVVLGTTQEDIRFPNSGCAARRDGRKLGKTQSCDIACYNMLLLYLSRPIQ